MINVDINSVEGIIFLSYLTKYNIAEIHKILEYQEHYYLETEYIENKRNGITEKFIDEALRTAKITIQKLKYYNIEPIPLNSSKYPIALRRLKDHPPILYVRGDLRQNSFAAIVGSRKASGVAESKVREISKVFISYDHGIVSGLALGIDTYAHQAALDWTGYTIAVLPTSLDTIYPLENFELANKIIDGGGALISELPLGVNRGKMSFIERNRIITAISDFVVPVEMGTNSGTMHTVNFCIQQHKKLLLPLPDSDTLNKYKTFYEGIVFLEQKYKGKQKDNVFSFKTMAELTDIIKAKPFNPQPTLF